jgi:putative zinc finger/helix-turn-helix YgiT family protein
MEEIAMADCLICGKKMKSTRENRKYDFSGLDGVTLLGVEVLRCSVCGEEEIGIPNIEGLHAALARHLAERKERLMPNEVRFLRKHLGLSTQDFARRMGVARETVARWESISEPLRMKTATERLLRLMVLLERPVDHYPDELDETATKEPRPLKTVLRFVRDRWERTKSAA